MIRLRDYIACVYERMSEDSLGEESGNCYYINSTVIVILNGPGRIYDTQIRV